MIEQVIEEQDIRSITNLIETFDIRQRNKVALMINSKSPQAASVEFPRVIYQPSPNLYLAYSTDPNDENRNLLEVIEFNEELNEYEFHKIEFDEPKQGLKEGVKRIFSPTEQLRPVISKNQTSCKTCHRVGPLWDTYAFWPGTYGSYHQVRSGMRNEQNSFRDLEQKTWNKNKKRYKKIKRIGLLRGIFHRPQIGKEHILRLNKKEFLEFTTKNFEDNNLDITKNIMKQYMSMLKSRIYEEVNEQPDLLRSFKFFMSAKVSDVHNFDEFVENLPPNLQEEFKKDFPERSKKIQRLINKHVEKGISEQRQIHKLAENWQNDLPTKLSFDQQNRSAEHYAIWDYLLEKMNIDFSMYSPSRSIGRSYYMFNDGGAPPWGSFFSHLREDIHSTLSHTSQDYRNITFTKKNNSQNSQSCFNAIRHFR